MFIEQLKAKLSTNPCVLMATTKGASSLLALRAPTKREPSKVLLLVVTSSYSYSSLSSPASSSCTKFTFHVQIRLKAYIHLIKWFVSQRFKGFIQVFDEVKDLTMTMNKLLNNGFLVQQTFTQLKM